MKPPPPSPTSKAAEARFRLRRVLYAAGLVVGLLMAVLYAALPRPPSLLAAATRVPDPARGMALTTGPFWETDERVVRSAVYFRQQQYITDLRTGQSTQTLYRYPEGARSADGKHSLSYSVQHGILIQSGDAAALRMTPAMLRYPRLIWLSDSQGWVEIDPSGKQAAIHAGGPTPMLALNPAFGWHGPGDVVTFARREADGSDRIYAISSPGGRSSACAVHEMAVSGGGASTRSWTAPGPPGAAVVMHVRLDPHGRRLAWSVQYAGGTSPGGVYQRLLRRLGIVEQPTAELWVSDLQGGEMRRLGSIPGAEPLPHIGWLPSGRRIWFEWQSSLWTIPAD